jgi:hypothetical protein
MYPRPSILDLQSSTFDLPSSILQAGILEGARDFCSFLYFLFYRFTASVDEAHIIQICRRLVKRARSTRKYFFHFLSGSFTGGRRNQ